MRPNVGVSNIFEKFIRNLIGRFATGWEMWLASVRSERRI